jgi:hypothetical protein
MDGRRSYHKIESYQDHSLSPKNIWITGVIRKQDETPCCQARDLHIMYSGADGPTDLGEMDVLSTKIRGFHSITICYREPFCHLSCLLLELFLWRISKAKIKLIQARSLVQTMMSE